MLARIRSLLFSLLFLSGLAFPANLSAAAPEDWVELSVGRFVVLYPANQGEEWGEAATLYGQAADGIYDQFARLYGPSPSLPINIRLYADAQQFASLNAVVPPLGPGVFHTHVGTREIALVAPFPIDFLNSTTVTNAMRHELNGLFLSSLSSGNLPPGLEVGVNQYVETPGPQVEQGRSRLLAAMADGLLLPWPELFESPAVYIDYDVAYPQSLSVAAFLIDSYGYGTLVQLVKATAAGQGYRSAFADVYAQPMDRLQDEWLAYLPQYIETRWQYNALFNYDLAPFEAALQAGAFAQTARGLDEVIPFLELTGQVKAQLEAENLRVMAGQGLAAADLVVAERDALVNGEYTLALDLAAQAREAFAAIGNTSRLEEIALYESRARELLDLHGQLDGAQRLAAAGEDADAEIQLMGIVPRLQALGDEAAAQEATALLAELRSRRAAGTLRSNLLIGGLAALVAGHLAINFLRGRRGKREPAIL
jgi:hypothetical protein